MTQWRGKRSSSSHLSQPIIPGLFGQKIAPTPRRHSPSSPGESALTKAQTRLPLIFLIFCGCFLTIAGRLSFLALGNQPTEPNYVQAASGYAPVTARADIVDRHGTILATSLPTMLLMANTHNIMDPRKAAESLSRALPDLSVTKLYQAFTTHKRYIILRRHLTPRQYYAVNKLGITGLEFMPDESRIYPAGALTTHILGYTDIDNIGIAGLEKTLNQELQEKPHPIASSLDIRLQTVLHRELSLAIKEYKALGAAGIIMDVNTGEILSLVSLPDFDPQNIGNASNNALFNKATLGVYEMGSTFKLFNTAMALDSGRIRLGERFDTIHPIEIGGQKIRDFHSSKNWQNLAEIFVKSSNIGSARIADRLGTETQQAFLSQLGLTSKPSLEIPEIGKPIVPKGKHWGKTATMTISFGHGIAVSTLQVAAAAAPLVNGGFTIKPTLLKQEKIPLKKERVISKRTSAQMRALMRLAVKYGTGKKANAPGYLVGGKTGTADKLNGRNYSDTARISSFLGVFPINAPRYLVLALLDDPKGNTKTHGNATAGWTAAPIVGKVIRQIGPLLNLSPIESDVKEAIERRLLRPLGNHIVKNLKKPNGMNSYAAVESNSTR